MSYDLTFFTPRPGVDVHDIVEVGEDRARGKRDPKTEAKKKKVSDALLAHDQRLELFKVDYKEVAKLCGVAVAAADSTPPKKPAVDSVPPGRKPAR